MPNGGVPMHVFLSPNDNSLLFCTLEATIETGYANETTRALPPIAPLMKGSVQSRENDGQL
jgi:hypothetical protein